MKPLLRLRFRVFDRVCLHFILRTILAIHPIQNQSGMGYQGMPKSLKVFYLHNSPNNSKSSCPQGHVGSNPTRSATNPLKTLDFQGVFFCPVGDGLDEKSENGAHGALICGAEPNLSNEYKCEF